MRGLHARRKNICKIFRTIPPRIPLFVAIKWRDFLWPVCVQMKILKNVKVFPLNCRVIVRKVLHKDTYPTLIKCRFMTPSVVATKWEDVHGCKILKSGYETGFKAGYRLKEDKSSVNEKIRKFIYERLYFTISCPWIYEGVCTKEKTLRKVQQHPELFKFHVIG